MSSKLAILAKPGISTCLCCLKSLIAHKILSLSAFSRILIFLEIKVPSSSALTNKTSLLVFALFKTQH